MQPMQKTLIIVLITALAGAGIGVGATLLLRDDDDRGVAIPTPFSTFSPDVSPTESPSPSPTASPTVSPATTAAATATPVATSSTTSTSTEPPSGSAPATRRATSVNCNTEPQFCSNATGMRVSNGRLADTSQSPGGRTDPSRYPTITMTTRFLRPGGGTAQEGDEFSTIVVDVLVENRTSNRTFVFPRREVALVITKNGQAYDTLLTRGEGFQMPPQGKLRAHYERPFLADGNYRWVAKTWYYTKS
jgi:hypothetical protein